MLSSTHFEPCAGSQSRCSDGTPAKRLHFLAPSRLADASEVVHLDHIGREALARHVYGHQKALNTKKSSKNIPKTCKNYVKTLVLKAWTP